MKKIILLLVFAILAISSCSKAKTSNVSANTPVNSTTSVNTNSPVNTNLSNTNLSNQTTVSETKSEVNSEMLKQIEAQQLETADPRKVTKQNAANSNQAPKKSVPPGMQN